MSNTRIAVVYTGGTLGMAENASGQLVPLAFAELEPRLLSLAAGFDVTLLPVTRDAEPLPPIDSSAVSPEFWQALAATLQATLQSYDSAIVLHGTDTMAYSLAAMGFALGPLAKRVVFTGSQRPLSQVGSDAPANFQLALAAASEPVGLRLAFGGQLLAGMRVSKSHSHADTGFSERTPPNDVALSECKLGNAFAFSRGVMDITLTPALSANALQAQLQTASAAVVRLYGSGTSSLPIAALAMQAKQQTPELTAVLLVSACHNGGIEQQVYATSAVTGGIVISGCNITPEAAVVKLMWLLGDKHRRAKLTTLLAANVAGELG